MQEVAYWTGRESNALRRAKTVHDLRRIAFAVLERMPKPICQVCGPISTGGRGSIEENLAVFRRTIEAAQRKGHNVFDQTVFENAMHRMKPENGYHWDVLYHFYKPIFKSGHIKCCLFISGWEKSTGSLKEFGYAKRFGIKVVYLEPDWHLL